MQEFTTFLAHHVWLVTAAAITFILLIIVEVLRAKQQSYNVSPAHVIQLINKKNAVVIDIRKKEAYLQGHIIDAHNIPADDITKNSKKLEKFKNRPIILISQIPTESQKTAAFLINHGYHAFSLSGGIKSWLDAQMPLVKE